MTAARIMGFAVVGIALFLVGDLATRDILMTPDEVGYALKGFAALSFLVAWLLQLGVML